MGGDDSNDDDDNNGEIQLSHLAAKNDIEAGGYADVGGEGSFLGGNPDPIGM